MKYIDAEKLIDEIERFSATEYGGNTFGDDVANGALDYVLEEIIPSLQQEQQDVDIREEIKKLEFMGSNDARDILHVAEHFYELGLKAK